MATFDTRDLAAAVVICLKHIYRPQHADKKAGVLLMDLVKRERVQPGLFPHRDPQAARRLMGVVDQVNREHGAGMLRLAGASPFQLRPCRTWHLRSDHRSPRYTTRWEELPEVRAGGKHACAAEGARVMT